MHMDNEFIKSFQNNMMYSGYSLNHAYFEMAAFATEDARIYFREESRKHENMVDMFCTNDGLFSLIFHILRIAK